MLSKDTFVHPLNCPVKRMDADLKPKPFCESPSLFLSSRNFYAKFLVNVVVWLIVFHDLRLIDAVELPVD